MMQLDGRVAIVTGSNQGLGLAIAQAYVKAGARVCICARDRTRLAAAAVALEAEANAPGRIAAVAADVSVPQDCAEVIKVALATFGHVDILVNNAAIHGPKGAVEDADWQDWLRAIEINLFGSILMCRALLPHLKARRAGKIIQLSGGGATNPRPMLSAYAVSKAAVVRFAETLAEELREFNVQVNAIAPGALNTRLLDDILEAGPEKVGKSFYEEALKQRAEGGVPLSVAAELAVFLASAQSDGITGKLISAPWDRWQEWPQHVADLAKSDVYTLRRITGRDRGMDWGDK